MCMVQREGLTTALYSDNTSVLTINLHTFPSHKLTDEKDDMKEHDRVYYRTK